MSMIEIILYSACALALIGIAVAAGYNIGYWRGEKRGRTPLPSEGRRLPETSWVDVDREYADSDLTGWAPRA